MQTSPCCVEVAVQASSIDMTQYHFQSWQYNLGCHRLGRCIIPPGIGWFRVGSLPYLNFFLGQPLSELGDLTWLA